MTLQKLMYNILLPYLSLPSSPLPPPSLSTLLSLHPPLTPPHLCLLPLPLPPPPPPPPSSPHAPGVQLSCLHWNPQEYPEQLAISTSDGTLHLLAVIDDVRIQQQKPNLHANAGQYTCTCTQLSSLPLVYYLKAI